MTEADDRLERTVRRFVADYLPSFLGLLSDQGVEPEEQRIRADRLVRSLVEADVESGLRENGRRIIVEIDDGSEPPEIVFNRSFVEDVDGDEALGLLENPVEDLLELTSFRVNLLLQIDDEDSRKSLVHRARRSDGAELAGLADVPSVVELRLQVFLERLRAAAEAFAEFPELEFDIRTAVGTVVSSDASSWPSWEKVSDTEPMEELLEQLDEAVASAPASPEAATLAEICWESLQLSPRSSLRQAAEMLRAERNAALDLGAALREFGDVLADDSDPFSENARDWPGFRDLYDRWEELFRTEQRVLSWSPVRRTTPEFSVFEPPLSSLGLDEPESLPWDVPLLCWNVRERRALTDLLEGTTSTIAEAVRRDDFERIEIGTFSSLTPLEQGERAEEFALRPISGGGDGSIPDRDRLGRALRACYGRMFRSFCRLDRDRQSHLLTRLREAYGGYFGDVDAVWERRFQAVDSYEPPRAFRLLSREVDRVLGASALLDPFEGALEAEPSRVPSFAFVAAFAEGESAACVRIPLIGVRAAFDEAPAVIRAVEVPEDEAAPCRWIGDEEVPLQRLAGLPARNLLESIQRDAVRVRVERP